MAKDNKGKTGREAIDGIFGGLSELLDKLGEAVGSAEQHFDNQESDEKLKGVYGFSFKVGLGGKGPHVQSFGNVRKDKATGKSTVHKVREPMVDIFEEEDHTLVVAEMPGISADDVIIAIDDDRLTLTADRGEKRYHKVVHLPRSYNEDQVSMVCNNGIVEIRCRN